MTSKLPANKKDCQLDADSREEIDKFLLISYNKTTRYTGIACDRLKAIVLL